MGTIVRAINELIGYSLSSFLLIFVFISFAYIVYRRLIFLDARKNNSLDALKSKLVVQKYGVIPQGFWDRVGYSFFPYLFLILFVILWFSTYFEVLLVSILFSDFLVIFLAIIIAIILSKLLPLDK